MSDILNIIISVIIFTLVMGGMISLITIIAKKVWNHF